MHVKCLGRLTRITVATAAMTTGLFLGSALTAQAEETASDYVVEGQVDADGTLRVAATVSFDGKAPASLVQRLDTTRPGMNYTTYRFAIDDIQAKSEGVDLAPKITKDGDFQVITIDTSKASGKPIKISYRVVGAAVAREAAPGGQPETVVTWPVLQGLNVGVAQASGEVKVPGMITSVDCRAGAPETPNPCKLWAGGTHEARYPYFESNAVGAGGIIELSFGVPSSAVTPNGKLIEQWTLDRAFSVKPLHLWTAVGALLAGALALWRIAVSLGSDATKRKKAMLIADFAPTGPGEVRFTLVEKVRPGHVGTVLDERIDPVDVTATVLDLAARGHLRIHELEQTNIRSQLDWKFERLNGPADLRPYEKTLLEALAPANGEGVVVSEISEPIEKVIPIVQDQLYDDVVEHGWFSRRPDVTRNFWGTIGWVSLVAAVIAFVLIVMFTKFGLLGLALIALAIGILYIAQIMPRRTVKGVELRNGLEALSVQLHTQPVDQLPKDDVYGQISRILPYTVVLGGHRRWLEALVAADNDPDVPDPEDLSWYHAPNDWNLSDLPDALRSFVTTMQGELYGRS